MMLWPETPEGNVPQQDVTREADRVVVPVDHVALGASNLWGWSDLVLFLGFVALAFLVSIFTVTAGYVALKNFANWHTPPEDIQRNPVFQVSFLLAFYGLLLGLVFALVVGYHRQPFWSSLNWRKPSAGKIIGYLAGGFVMALGVGFAPTFLPDKQNFPLEQMFTSPGDAYAVAVFAVLIAPFMEELIFRGVLFAIFERRAGVVIAVVITAVLFAALHIQEYWGAWNHVLLISLVGVVFSLARGLTGSLAPSVILHLAYNLSLMTALYFQSHHFRSLQSALAATLF